MLKRLRLTVSVLTIIAATVTAGGCSIFGGIEYWEATVTSVVDGDTIVLDNGLTVEYLGVAAPKEGERGWRDAAELNKSLVLNQAVRLEVNTSETYDSNRHVLAFVWKGEENINNSMVQAGLAKCFPYANHNQWDELLSTTQSEAKAEQLGIWGPPRRLDNGTFVQDTTRDGKGQLTVRDGQEQDAVVVMTTIDKVPILSVYVRTNEAVTINGIRDGRYMLYVTMGEDWDSESGHFTKDRSNFQFQDSLTFETTDGQCSAYAVTLQAVVGGNASTKDVDAGDFPATQ